MSKYIHYCWFGRNPKSSLILKCLKSWKKYCPDCEIIEWNEDNFDVNCCDYVKEAYNAKKWAFVSDYCRFYVLYNFGGVYLDTDVELVKSIDGIGNTFVGFECPEQCNSGLIRGAEKGDEICKEMLDSYNKDRFRMEDGSFNLKTVCERETSLLCKYGLERNDKLQIVHGTTVYPTEYFNPTNIDTGKMTLTQNTVSIHHYAASWLDDNERFKYKFKQLLRRFFGKNFVLKIGEFLRIFKKEK